MRDYAENESSEDSEEQDEMTVDFLFLNPPLVAVFDGEGYSLIGCKRTSKLQCLLCDHHCQHVDHFNASCKENDVHLDAEEPLQEKQCFVAISLPIPYPLPATLQSLHDKHDKHERGGLEFPLQLVPQYSSTLICEHGHLFSSEDPLANNWISRKGVVIHKEAVLF